MLVSNVPLPFMNYIMLLSFMDKLHVWINEIIRFQLKFWYGFPFLDIQEIGPSAYMNKEDFIDIPSDLSPFQYTSL